eukprot:5271750-Amphidinium_carterae.4
MTSSATQSHVSSCNVLKTHCSGNGDTLSHCTRQTDGKRQSKFLNVATSPDFGQVCVMAICRRICNTVAS